jgi:hypothetical protein
MIINSTDPKQIREELKPYVHLMALTYYDIRRTWRGPAGEHWYKFANMYEVEKIIQETVDICLDDDTCHAADTTGIHVKFVRAPGCVDVDVTFDIVPW